MSIDIMNAKVKELRELRRMADELAAEIEAIQDELKGHMTAQDTDTLIGSDWKITGTRGRPPPAGSFWHEKSPLHQRRPKPDARGPRKPTGVGLHS